LLAKNIHRITDEEIKFFTEKSEVPESLAKAKPDPSYGEDHQPLWRSKSNMARVTIFDGGHQMIPTAIFAWLGQQEKK